MGVYHLNQLHGGGTFKGIKARGFVAGHARLAILPAARREAQPGFRTERENLAGDSPTGRAAWFASSEVRTGAGTSPGWSDRRSLGDLMADQALKKKDPEGDRSARGAGRSSIPRSRALWRSAPVSRCPVRL